ncbi:MAG: outer membrane protein assembly factor BamB [Gammaproteobacteria bacterium]|nr:outer membrane protein assembly factor BamB [Gammaproteobacteria bacterium]
MKKITLITLAIITMFLAGCEMLGFDDDNAQKPVPLTSFKSTMKITKLWTNKNEDGALDQYLKLTPVVANGRVFSGCYRGVVVAVNPANGKNLWRVNVKSQITSGIAADDSLIFVGTGRSELIALKQANGAMAWRTQFLGEILAQPKISQNKVVVKSEDGKVIALNAKTGATLWTYKQNGSSLMVRGGSAPQIIGDYVIAGFPNGQLEALDLNSGKVLWKQTIAEPVGASVIERMTDIDADPVVADGLVFTATYQGHIVAVNLHNGQIAWQKDINSYSKLIADSQNVYVADAQGVIHAFNAKTGTEIWQQKALLGHVLTAPTIYDSVIIVGDNDGYLHFLSRANGNFVARDRADRSGMIASPVATTDGIYVMTKAGRLVKYTAAKISY